jgi:hypothetical protein
MERRVGNNKLLLNLNLVATLLPSPETTSAFFSGTRTLLRSTGCHCSPRHQMGIFEMRIATDWPAIPTHSKVPGPGWVSTCRHSGAVLGISRLKIWIGAKISE